MCLSICPDFQKLILILKGAAGKGRKRRKEAAEEVQPSVVRKRNLTTILRAEHTSISAVIPQCAFLR
ncbi:hypothetical protein R1flu_019119 [Riccia fluitans]|uniref:Uncharacterized protein n=1 Tax=Riccia fluitans TaxID=41844 RepID=A0ABD1ZJZ9_9MARC